MTHTRIDGKVYAEMILAGTANLSRHAQEINDLNVFPIPDGDTGENMMLTMQGGAHAAKDASADLSAMADKIAGGMLLGARGNSGVILSQFFAGIAEGFHTYSDADVAAIEKAVACGVGCAYEAVVTPTEGTILTVAKDAGIYAGNAGCETVEDYFCAFIEEAKRSLARTPELLPVLKEAGVVDSGGAGLICIMEGMYACLCGRAPKEEDTPVPMTVHTVNPDLFAADSVLEFGYCTELLLRLQYAKCDVEQFDIDALTEFLQSVGDSVVAVKNDSIVKLHVHTMTPYRVLEHCQRFGEFLTVKIENMMLQHNETVANEAAAPVMSEAVGEAKRFGLVTVATGEGIKQSFLEMGADEVIHGGQTMNPDVEDFLKAFDRVNAETIFVLPNNGNILLAAKQAAGLYKKSDVRVIPSRSIGQGYAALSMLDYDSGEADLIESGMKESMEGVLTAEISRSIREASIGGLDIHKDDYIGIMGKEILASDGEREAVACKTVDHLQVDQHSVILIIRGKDATKEESARVASYIKQKYPLAEICESEGGQDIYD
ncbi:MAG: DAK2 domain-containing protein, partial [Clostridia bacterium]|nr:DAK2 domain-containing protein [Clostridia bacterium]